MNKRNLIRQFAASFILAGLFAAVLAQTFALMHRSAHSAHADRGISRQVHQHDIERGDSVAGDCAHAHSDHWLDRLFSHQQGGDACQSLDAIAALDAAAAAYTVPSFPWPTAIVVMAASYGVVVGAPTHFHARGPPAFH